MDRVDGGPLSYDARPMSTRAPSPRTPAPIRVLLIGTGFGSIVHAPGFARNPSFALAGVASGSLENAKRVAAEFSIPYATDDWKRMLEEVEADLVSIAT